MSEGHQHSKAEHDPHTPIESATQTKSPYQRLESALRELLIAKGIFTAEEIRATIDILDSRTPALGARMVAKAWLDPDYKQRLLADGSKAAEELGIKMDGTHLVVLENTALVHNLVVCTLCSCYPRPVLGLPPEWYKNTWYRTRAVKEPRAVLAEFGTIIPEEVAIRVHDSTADLRYLVLPLQPEGTTHLNEAELAQLVTRDCMIGVAQVKFNA
jgi:nitrile hydratase alpha subunit